MNCSGTLVCEATWVGAEISDYLAVGPEVYEQRHCHNHQKQPTQMPSCFRGCLTSQFLKEGARVPLGNICVMVEEEND